MVTRLWRLIREVKADVLHAHNEGAGFYAGLAGLLAGRPVITTRHGASFGLDTLWVRRAAGPFEPPYGLRGQRRGASGARGGPPARLAGAAHIQRGGHKGVRSG